MQHANNAQREQAACRLHSMQDLIFLIFLRTRGGSAGTFCWNFLGQGRLREGFQKASLPVYGCSFQPLHQVTQALACTTVTPLHNLLLLSC